VLVVGLFRAVNKLVRPTTRLTPAWLSSPELELSTVVILSLLLKSVRLISDTYLTRSTKLDRGSSDLLDYIYNWL
jgi:hypothetical protein